MKKYDNYKDSGIEWIGEIPEHWEVKKIKHLTKLQGGYAFKSDLFSNEGTPIIRIGDISTNINFDECKKIDDDTIPKEYWLDQYDTLIALSGATTGKTCFVNNIPPKAYINQRVARIMFSNKLLYYVVNSGFFQEQILLTASGSAQENISNSQIENLEISISNTPEEQTAIANYLDHKTSEIDELITDKKRLIELYEEEKTAIINQAVTKGINADVSMKDSGIEWLGEIPEHWEMKRIRHVAQIFGRIGYRGYKTTDLVPKGEGAITISPSNMKAYHMEYENCTYLSWKKYEESPEIMIYNDDILFVKTGSTYGKVSFVENLPEKATINPQIIVLKQITCINKYLWYVLKSSNIIYQVERTVVGGTIPTISQAKINNYEFPIPSNQEQKEIVNFIDNETNRVEKLINKTEKLIDLLTEYRTALISEVVTGKIKVIP